jgi:CheY-like chemotaxis protein
MTRHAAILIVDDDRDEIDVALRALDRAGVDAPVEIARDGLEALELLGLEKENGASHETPSVVFLDLTMPRVDGFEVLQRMRENPATAEIPVVVLSSSDREEDIRRSYALGANSFLLKRFDRESPGGYVAEAARYWIELNRTA